MPHNHPPRCCCDPAFDGDVIGRACPSCVEHGELATLGECPSCHARDGHAHTDYCQRENREYPGQPGVRPDGRNADLHSTATGDVDLVGALHASIDAARTARRNGVTVPRALLEDSEPSTTAVVTNELEQSMKAGHGVTHPWCPNPCAYHGSPDR